MGRERARAKNLPADCDREREWNLGSRGTVGLEALEEAAGDPLHGNSVIPLVHVWTGRPGEESEVQEVPTALRNTTGCMLEGIGEWQIGNRQDGVFCYNEPDKKSRGRRRRLLQKLQAADQDPGKKSRSGTHGSSGGEGLDLVERREEPGGNGVRESDRSASGRGSHLGKRTMGVEARR